MKSLDYLIETSQRNSFVFALCREKDFHLVEKVPRVLSLVGESRVTGILLFLL